MKSLTIKNCDKEDSNVDLEEEERKIIEETARKGYMHHRHERKAEFETAPQRISESEISRSESEPRQIPDGTTAGGSVPKTHKIFLISIQILDFNSIFTILVFFVGME